MPLRPKKSKVGVKGVKVYFKGKYKLHKTAKNQMHSAEIPKCNAVALGLVQRLGVSVYLVYFENPVLSG